MCVWQKQKVLVYDKRVFAKNKNFFVWKHFKRTPDGSPMTDFFPDCIVKEWVKPNYYLTIEMDGEYKMTYLEISASRCSFQYPCLKVRHLPTLIKK